MFEALPDSALRMHVVLTHASGRTPDNAAGPVQYEEWQASRTNIMRNVMSHCLGDQNADWTVHFAENHHRCRTNAAGEPVLPNGLQWRVKMLGALCTAATFARATLLTPPGRKRGAKSAAQQQNEMVRRLMQQVRL